MASQVDEIFGVVAPKFIGRAKRTVDDERASKQSTGKKRRKSERGGRLSAADEEAILEVSRTTGKAAVKAAARADAAAAAAAAVAKEEALVAKALGDQVKKTAKAMAALEVDPIIADVDVMNELIDVDGAAHLQARDALVCGGEDACAQGHVEALGTALCRLRHGRT